MNDYQKIIESTKDTMDWLLSQSDMNRDLLDIPELHQVRKRGVLYSKYGESVKESYEVASALSTAYVCRSNIKKMIRVVRLDKETPQSLLAPVRAQLEAMLSSMEEIVNALVSKKEGVDNMVRFYSSVQYILGSPRLDGLDG